MPEAENVPFLEIVFDAKGQEKKVHIFKRPLGVDLGKRSSELTKVNKVKAQSYARELGLKVGWAVKSVGGEDMSKKTFQQVQNAVMTGLMRLPLEPHKEL